MATRKTADDYRSLAGDQFEWLAKETPANHNVKTIWRCKKSRHVFWKSYLAMYKHRCCPLCTPVRKSERDYQRLAARKNMEWLGPLPHNVRETTFWKCLRCGNVRSAPYALVYRYSGCPKCGRENFFAKLRHAEQEYQQLAEKAELVFLGPPAKSIRTKTNWRCLAKGHQLFLSYYSIRRLVDSNDGIKHAPCRQCYIEKTANRRRKPAEEYHALARRKNMIWLGPAVTNNRTKTFWRSSCGHVIHSSWGLVDRNSSDCPICAAKKRGRKRRLTTADYHRHAEEHGFEWIASVLPETTHAPTRWRCKTCQGEFERSLYKIYQLRRCPLCRDSQRKTVEDYHTLAHENELLWSGNFLPENTRTKTTWLHMECRQEFEQSYQQIQAGVGCPRCKHVINGCVVSRPQLLLMENTEKIWQVPCRLNEIVLDISIDIVAELDGRQIAIFYDGSTWHSSETVQARDQMQTKTLIENGWYVWRVLSDVLVPNDEEILSALKRILETDERLIITQLRDWKSRPPIIDRLHPERGQ